MSLLRRRIVFYNMTFYISFPYYYSYYYRKMWKMIYLMTYFPLNNQNILESFVKLDCLQRFLLESLKFQIFPSIVIILIKKTEKFKRKN